MGFGATATALTRLIPALTGLRERRRVAALVRIGCTDYPPIAVLPRGQWTTHAGTWVRVNKAYISSAADRSAPLSDGEVIELRKPVIVVAGHSEPRYSDHVAP